VRCHRTPSQVTASAPRIARRGAWGVPDGSTVGMTVRAGTASTRKCAPRMVLPIVFGKNMGGRRGAVPCGLCRVAPRRAGGMRDKARTCREMHELQASVAASFRG